MRTLFLTVILFIIICTCSESTSPPPNNGPDTTSHNFVWQIDTFHTNQFQSNIFWDIRAVAEDNVWAVGTVYVDSTDSMDNYIEPYNAAHWDGVLWNLKRFKYNSDGYLTVINTIRSIWYFSDNNIWFGSGSIFHFNGKQTKLIHRPNLENFESVQHLWAASENEIYAVGTKGLILKYNGSGWNKMASGTDMDFQDIWGTIDKETGQVEVWAVGFDEQEYHGIVLKYNGEKWETLFSSEKSIYGEGNDHKRPIAVFGFTDSVYIALDGFETSKIVRHSKKDFTAYTYVNEVGQGAIIAINGASKNDYFAVGFRDVVLHYNGSSFKKYFDWIYIDGRFHGVQQVGDEVFICGKRFGWNTGVLLHGTRITN